MDDAKETRSAGKLARLRRLRVGGIVVPVAHPEVVRGPRAKNAERLKQLVGRFYDESRAVEVHHDVDSYEPPMRAQAPRSQVPGLSVSHPSDYDDVEDDEC